MRIRGLLDKRGCFGRGSVLSMQGWRDAWVGITDAWQRVQASLQILSAFVALVLLIAGASSLYWFPQDRRDWAFFVAGALIAVIAFMIGLQIAPRSTAGILVIRDSFRLELMADGIKQKFTRELTVRSRIHDVAYIPLRYLLTASGKPPEISAVTPGHFVVMNPEMVQEKWQDYLVYFKHPLSKGSEAKVVIEMKIDDSNHTFKEFFTKVIREQTRQLVLELKFASTNWPGDHAFCAEMGVHGSRKRKNCKEKELVLSPKDRTTRLEIDSPRMNHEYGIKWNSSQKTSRRSRQTLTSSKVKTVLGGT